MMNEIKAVPSLDRYQIINASAAMLPGNCVICGAFSGKFIDFGLYIEGHGNIYIDTNCFVNIANHMGYLSPEQSKIKDNMIHELQQFGILVAKENEELRNAVDAIRNLANPVSIPKLPDMDSVETSTKSTKGKDGPSQQTNESRSKNIFGDDSLDGYDI